jgi:hypothetical protein
MSLDSFCFHFIFVSLESGLWPSLATRLTFGYNRGNAFGPEWIECADFLPSGNFFWNNPHFKADFFTSGNFFWNVPQFQSRFFLFLLARKKVATPNIEGCFSFGGADFLLLRTFSFFVAQLQSSNLTEGQMDENGKRKQ